MTVIPAARQEHGRSMLCVKKSTQGNGLSACQVMVGNVRFELTAFGFGAQNRAFTGIYRL